MNRAMIEAKIKAMFPNYAVEITECIVAYKLPVRGEYFARLDVWKDCVRVRFQKEVPEARVGYDWPWQYVISVPIDADVKKVINKARWKAIELMAVMLHLDEGQRYTDDQLQFLTEDGKVYYTAALAPPTPVDVDAVPHHGRRHWFAR